MAHPGHRSGEGSGDHHEDVDAGLSSIQVVRQPELETDSVAGQVECPDSRQSRHRSASSASPCGVARAVTGAVAAGWSALRMRDESGQGHAGTGGCRLPGADDDRGIAMVDLKSLFMEDD